MVETRSVVVVGCGGVGSAALYHLARRGFRVLGIDRFGRAHDRGSSHGQTRAIRMAYFEHPNYVPLLRRAYTLWRDLERETGTPLFHEVGLIEVGPADGELIPGVLASADQYQLPVERWSRQQLIDRCPVFRVPDGLEIVYERNAGYLLVEACVEAHLTMALQFGAQLRTPTQVLHVDRQGSQIELHTDQGRFLADQVVVCGGPWTTTLLADLELPLHVVRKPQHWFAPESSEFRVANGCPVFFFEVEQSFFYGFPEHDTRGVKLAQHKGGRVLDQVDSLERDVDLAEQRQVVEFASKYLTGLRTPPHAHSVCMYTMTPDGHFILDRHPKDPRMVFATGLSGHGFKFATVLGEILADWVEQGTTSLPCEFLQAGRPGRFEVQ